MLSSLAPPGEVTRVRAPARVYHRLQLDACAHAHLVQKSSSPDRRSTAHRSPRWLRTRCAHHAALASAAAIALPGATANFYHGHVTRKIDEHQMLRATPRLSARAAGGNAPSLTARRAPLCRWRIKRATRRGADCTSFWWRPRRGRGLS